MNILWIFDFDGTLVDSEKAIKKCYIKVGKEIVPDRLDYIKSMIIGPTLDESSELILTEKNIHLKEIFKKTFQQLYDEKIVFKTPIYNGVQETLEMLYNRGDILTIATNKRSKPTHKLINFYGWQNFFKNIMCIDDYKNIKNKSELIKLMNIDEGQYKNIYFIGDTLNDQIAAKDNNLKFILANYGYGKNQDWHKALIYKEINNIKELLDL